MSSSSVLQWADSLLFRKRRKEDSLLPGGVQRDTVTSEVPRPRFII